VKGNLGYNKLRNLIISILKYLLPKGLFEKLKHSKQVSFYLFWRLIWELRANIFPNKYHRDPYVKDGWYLVNPEKIIFASREFDFYTSDGRVMGGDWDVTGIKKFEEFDFFRSFQDRILNKTPWIETEYCQRVVSEISQGKIKWGCRTVEDFMDRLKKLDLIFENIKRNGYQQIENEEGITINFGRDGDLLFNSGRHRLTFCKLLGIKKIPVRISVRHSNWVKFKNEILKYARNHNGKVYASLTHLDLQTVPSHYGYDRFQLIVNNLSIQEGSLLDIGSHWGYFCHKFEEAGFDCLALENDITNLYYLRKLRRAENRQFKIVADSALNFGKKKRNFDIVLTLAIFHHFIKEENTYHDLIRLLRNLRMKEMFFLPHLPEEKQMEGAFKNYNPEEFTAFIIEHSCLKHTELIGYAEDGRPMYKMFI
jgi:2-polyprenyl-3-methyl-5-hydroxy-6-metoxy-1,4-benzoquinol methylase